MLGRPGCWLPVCTNVIAGSWLIASVCIERTMHNSSATAPRCGSASLIQAPSPPLSWRVKWNDDGATGKRVWPDVMPVSRWPLRTDSGKSLSYCSCRRGLWSNRSRWLGPPSMCR
jgi:hypothetical protein